MRNRFMIATLSTTLVLSGCASTDNKEKKDEKVVHKKKETMEVKQDAVSLPEEAETKHKEYELSETLADHAEFYLWTNNVDQSQEPMITESTYNKLSENEATNIIRNGSAIGFVWYNAQAKITKIVFFGSTICQ